MILLIESYKNIRFKYNIYMSQIDDIIQSYVDERLANQKIIEDDSENESEGGFDLFDQESESIETTNIFDEDESISENKEETKISETTNYETKNYETKISENREIDYQELIKLNQIQSERIRKLEEDRNHIGRLHREIANLKSEIVTIKEQKYSKRTEMSSSESSDESSVDDSQNREFDFIPMIVRKKKKIKPMFCGRSISNYKRFTKDLCQSHGCIRCHLDVLINNGYSIEKLREVREAFVRL